jgi:hypothetical protein
MELASLNPKSHTTSIYVVGRSHMNTVSPEHGTLPQVDSSVELVNARVCFLAVVLGSSSCTLGERFIFATNICVGAESQGIQISNRLRTTDGNPCSAKNILAQTVLGR